MTSSSIRRCTSSACAAIGPWLAVRAAIAREPTVYVSGKADTMTICSERFAKAHPAVRINGVRDSTGIVQARLMAGKDNSRNDLIVGHAQTGRLAVDPKSLKDW